MFVLNRIEKSKIFFDLHCESISKGADVVFMHNDKKVKLKTFNELSKFFPQLDAKFKEDIKEKYKI